jgi:hypothetical protein
MLSHHPRPVKVPSSAGEKTSRFRLRLGEENSAATLGVKADRNAPFHVSYEAALSGRNPSRGASGSLGSSASSP